MGEFILGPGARLNYIALQDWAPNVYNLAILRARVAAGASIHWIDCNLGGRLTMKYPCTLLEGEGAAAESISISVARSGQHHDTGAKMFHRAARTTSTITAKSVSLGTGRADYRAWWTCGHGFRLPQPHRMRCPAGRCREPVRHLSRHPDRRDREYRATRGQRLTPVARSRFSTCASAAFPRPRPAV